MLYCIDWQTWQDYLIIPQLQVISVTSTTGKIDILSDNHLFSVDLDVGDVVLEDGGDVDHGELVLAEDDHETAIKKSG